MDDNNSPKEERGESPLETMAEVACRVGMSLTAKRENNFEQREFEMANIKRRHEKRRVTLETAHMRREMDDQFIEEEEALFQKEYGSNASASMQFSMGMFRGYHLEALKRLAEVRLNFGDMRHFFRQEMRDFQELLTHQLKSFNSLVLSRNSEVKEELEELKREIRGMRNASPSVEKGDCPLDGGTSYVIDDGEAVRLSSQSKEEAMFVITRDDDERDAEGSKEIRMQACGLKIGVEGRSGTKRRLVASGSRCSGSSGPYMKKTKLEMEDVEDFAAVESGNSSSADEGKDGRGKVRMGRRFARVAGTRKRRRDNWTEEENVVFMTMVLENGKMEEMDLRRKLARHFSPRRTHEQCANHLRILRAQKKLPAAREEAQPLKGSKLSQ